MISGEQIALAHIERMERDTKNDVDHRIQRIDKDNVMRPVTYKSEMERKLRNEINWCYRARKKANDSIAYFKTQDDGARFIATFEDEIHEINEKQATYKAALAGLRQEVAA